MKNLFIDQLTRKLLSIFGESFSDKKLPVTLLVRCLFVQKFIGINRRVPWPVHWTSQIRAPHKIVRGTRFPGLALGCYIDGRNGIIIGENTWIGPGVKIISMNHDMNEYSKYLVDNPIKIAQDCWIASNVVILPGVEIGPHTVVAAGAVVTKSFPEKDQVLAGVPARIVKTIKPYSTYNGSESK